MDYVTSGYAHVECSNATSATLKTTADNISIGGNTTTARIQPSFYPYQYSYFWPSGYYPTNEAALRETIREKEAVIEEMRELVEMQRRLLDAILPKGRDE